MLEKAYYPKQYENEISKLWEEKCVFKPKKWLSNSLWKDLDKKNTHINILPPPNANGELHLGHASWYTIMDIAWRFARMQGKETLLLPGKDHAWILTQTVFEKILLKQWIKRQDLWREEFYKRCYNFCIESAEIMRSQEKRIWISADWDREKFTLDPVISEKTLETFVKMYNDWLAYRSNRIINWCPHCLTALSDMEVEHKDYEWFIWELKYPILEDMNWKASLQSITVATTRPETMLGDTAVAVNPKDSRYKDLIWKKILLPIVNREIPIIADSEVDMEFGTWAVKVTPAHDPLDYQIWKRNKLQEIQVIWFDGKMTHESWKEFEWLTTEQARKLVIEKFKDLWLLVSEKKYTKPLSCHDRCWKVIEPLISDQWWINVDHPKFSLKNEAIKAVKEWKIKIIPKYFEKTFFHWMENLKDWCISRQIWWSHQIPAWYCKDCLNIDVVLWIQNKCSKCWSKNIYQDPDTFDTWFSSGQWAHNTVIPFLWDEKYFPWDFMVMWRDILPFWACRMIMMSLYSTRQAPFKTLYLTWLILDKNGKKMSKSKWNWINPLEMCDKYWTDALRLSLFLWNSPWSDMRLWEEKIENNRNFVNKLWNASRFIQLQITNSNLQIDYDKIEKWDLNISNLTDYDKWIITSLQRLIHEVTNDIEDFEYSNAGQKLYDFTWNEFCDWYIELSKWDKQNIEVLIYVLQTLLKLLHPFIPFVTEVIYKELFSNEISVAEMSYPKYIHNLIFEDSLKNIDFIISTIKSIRIIRTEIWIEPIKKINAKIKTSSKIIINAANEIKRIWRIENLEIWDDIEKSKWDISQIVNSFIEVIVSSELNIDKEKEKIKKAKEIDDLSKRIEVLELRLSNKSYTEKAPKHLIDQSINELHEMKIKLTKLKE